MKKIQLALIALLMIFAASTTYAQMEAKQALDGKGTSSPGAEAPSSNDDCANATAITAFGTVTEDVTDNNSDPSDPGFSCQLFSTNFQQTTWWTIEAATDGLLSISACGNDYDGLLGIYTGSCGSLTEVACGEDECDGSDGSFFAPEIVDFPVTAGTVYYIAYADWGSFPDSELIDLEISGTFEFPSDEVVPTMGEWGTMILAIGLMIFAVVGVRQKSLSLA